MLRFVIGNHPERTRNRSLTENSWLQPALIFSPVLTRVQAWKRYRIRMIATRRRSDYYAGCRPEFATMYPLINNLERRANSPSPSPVTELDRSFAGNERYGYIGCWTTVENFLRTLVPGSWKVGINWGLQFFFLTQACRYEDNWMKEKKEKLLSCYCRVIRIIIYLRKHTVLLYYT